MRARPATRLVTLFLAVLLGGVLLASSASAADGGIDHVEAVGRELRLLLSLGEATGDATSNLDGVTVTFDGAPLEAEAAPLEEAATTLRRTAVLAVDVSDSMRGARFTAAKEAARAFLADVPDDVRVGLVTYAGEVEVAQQPTSDVAQVAAAVDRLELSRGTRLYDGVREAGAVAGEWGAGKVLGPSHRKGTSGKTANAAGKRRPGHGRQVEHDTARKR